MIRRFVNWLLILLKIRSRVPEKSLLELLQELLPAIYTVTFIMGLSKELRLYIHVPWYRILWYKIQHYFRVFRIVVIGY